MRRMIDIIFASAWLLLTLPLMLGFAILIKIESPGPVFYKPKMVGWKGKVFSLFRFRTVHIDFATEQQFTHIGRFIRNYSLDHLPQLFNLLKGDLTLIGPRPMEVDVANLQDSTWQQYVQAKPGLISYAVYRLGKQWTPSRSSHPDLNQQLELQYLKQRSIGSDAELFLQTFRKLIVSKGNLKERGEVDPKLNREQSD